MSTRKSFTFASSLIVALTLFSNPVSAGDPFRPGNPYNMGDETEEAFDTLFREGKYQEAIQDLQEAEKSDPDEPLVYALRAALAFMNEDLSTMNSYASKTIQAADNLVEADEDSLRGNLYLAVGHFLEGAYQYKNDGPIGAVTKLQKVFEYLDKAEAIDPNDPEMNMLKGYMELLLAVNLPFSNAEQAIDKFKNKAAPEFLVNHGIAVAYRDLGNKKEDDNPAKAIEYYEKGLGYVEQSLKAIPDNREVVYLRGQIFYKLGKNKQDISLLEKALEDFETALANEQQLPPSRIKAIKYEQEVADRKLKELRGS
ncbi:MAG: Sll0314/Alr1548 family TPR repeat-containing protein [Spirulinaceae cyanobacterium]